MRLDEVAEQIVTELVAAGVKAVLDIRDLNTPAAYVVLDRIEFDMLAGYTARWAIYAVAANTGRAQAYKQLGPLVEQIRDVWHCQDGTHVDLAIPDSADPLPAIRLTVATGVTYE